MKRSEILDALTKVTGARRDAQVLLDDAVQARLARTTLAESEEEEQTLGALVRQLENARRELVDAVRSCDQLVVIENTIPNSRHRSKTGG